MNSGCPSTSTPFALSVVAKPRSRRVRTEFMLRANGWWYRNSTKQLMPNRKQAFTARPDRCPVRARARQDPREVETRGEAFRLPEILALRRVFRRGHAANPEISERDVSGIEQVIHGRCA